MNEDRVVGSARKLGGKAQEGFGRVTGDTDTQIEGAINQAAGAAQDIYGQAKDFDVGRSSARAPTRYEFRGLYPPDC